MNNLKSSSKSEELHHQAGQKPGMPGKQGLPLTAKQSAQEVFRKDLISAMMLPDSAPLPEEGCWFLQDSWRPEWEKGVQVPYRPQAIPQTSLRLIKYEDSYAKGLCLPMSTGISSHHMLLAGNETVDMAAPYDLDELDVHWLHCFNEERWRMGMKQLGEAALECLLAALEARSAAARARALSTEAGLGIEYDEDVVCDVCRSPHAEDGNEMVFCDRCDVCVHQACYGIERVPRGSWLCAPCAKCICPPCVLCPRRGGAMKPSRSGSRWAHVSCALWIPEVSIGCAEKMEPVLRLSQVPPARRALLCCICHKHVGACIQCSDWSCVAAFHVTCAFTAGLSMQTLLDQRTDQVRFRASCPQHTALSGSVDFSDSGNEGQTLSIENQQQPLSSHRKQRLLRLDEEFFGSVQPSEVARSLGLSEDTADFVFQYWKLRRRGDFNHSLLRPPKTEAPCVGNGRGGTGTLGGQGLSVKKGGTKEEEEEDDEEGEEDNDYDDESKKEGKMEIEDVECESEDGSQMIWKEERDKEQYTEEKAEEEETKFDDQQHSSPAHVKEPNKLSQGAGFTHLRQNLERARNLCYMVLRREKLKGASVRLCEQLFFRRLQLQLAQHGLPQIGVKVTPKRRGRRPTISQTAPASSDKPRRPRGRPPRRRAPEVLPVPDNTPSPVTQPTMTPASLCEPRVKACHVRVTPSNGGKLKNWGGFRIPKKSDLVPGPRSPNGCGSFFSSSIEDGDGRPIEEVEDPSEKIQDEMGSLGGPPTPGTPPQCGTVSFAGMGRTSPSTGCWPYVRQATEKSRQQKSIGWFLNSAVS
uniref:protein Jade-1-like isoform X2 n=1 Tax=Myxine glutinosa TaxID=7769 RepID=UPI00358F99E2